MTTAIVARVLGLAVVLAGSFTVTLMLFPTLFGGETGETTGAEDTPEEMRADVSWSPTSGTEI
jgi:hypothetical protein